MDLYQLKISDLKEKIANLNARDEECHLKKKNIEQEKQEILKEKEGIEATTLKLRNILDIFDEKWKIMKDNSILNLVIYFVLCIFLASILVYPVSAFMAVALSGFQNIMNIILFFLSSIALGLAFSNKKNIKNKINILKRKDLAKTEEQVQALESLLQEKKNRLDNLDMALASLEIKISDIKALKKEIMNVVASLEYRRNQAVQKLTSEAFIQELLNLEYEEDKDTLKLVRKLEEKEE